MGVLECTVQILLLEVSCDNICLFQKTLDRRRFDNTTSILVAPGVRAGNLACILPAQPCDVMHHVCQYIREDVRVDSLRFKIRTSDMGARTLARRHFRILNQHLVERRVVLAHVVADSLRVNRLVRLPQPVICTQTVLEVRRRHVCFRFLIHADNTRYSIR